MKRIFEAGDLVIYSKEKVSTHPGRRAHHVWPSQNGDLYHYLVDKYWVVVGDEGEALVVRTPGGKIHRIRRDDPALRRASLSERLWLRLRAPDRWHALRGA